MLAATLILASVVALGVGALATFAGAVLAVVATPTDSDVGFHPRMVGAFGLAAGLLLFTSAACALFEQLRP